MWDVYCIQLLYNIPLPWNNFQWSRYFLLNLSWAGTSYNHLKETSMLNFVIILISTNAKWQMILIHKFLRCKEWLLKWALQKLVRRLAISTQTLSLDWERLGWYTRQCFQIVGLLQLRGYIIVNLMRNNFYLTYQLWVYWDIIT